jgi:hypothetical protein
MSILRINHTKNELITLNSVIGKITEFQNRDLPKRTPESKNINKDDHNGEPNNTQNPNLISKTEVEMEEYIEPTKVLKSLAKFQNELMLVKHTALIENMIINVFRNLVLLKKNAEYEKMYFIDNKNFSDGYLATNLIKELTNGILNFKKCKFWYLYETMKTIRNTIAHGDPLFVMSYGRVTKFNKEIDIIARLSEKNEDRDGHQIGNYPSLLHPTNDTKSNWFCTINSNLGEIQKLNTKCIQFTEEVRKLYLNYGRDANFSDHELYSYYVA